MRQVKQDEPNLGWSWSVLGSRGETSTSPPGLLYSTDQQAQRAEIYSIQYLSILKFYSVVSICDYIRKPANAGELDELLLVFMVMNLPDSRIN